MPDPSVASPVNWDAVRVLAIAVGVREAARRCQISEEATMKRSQREGWLSSPEAREANRQVTVEKIRQNNFVSAPRPQTAAQAMSQELLELGSKTKLGLAKGLAKAAAHVETMSGPAILGEAQNVKSVAQTASIVHGWEKQSAPAKMRLELLGTKQDGIAIEVESEVVRDDWEE